VRVTSWRDSASQEAQHDLDRLVNAAIPFAAQMLDERGEFFPYGVSLDSAGEERMVAADPENGERPASAAVLTTLVEGLRRQRDSLRAVALVADVRLPDSDAVRVELEHRDGQAIAVFLPYRKKRLRSGVNLGELRAGPATPQVWSA
jgi:hypothetical protein